MAAALGTRLDGAAIRVGCTPRVEIDRINKSRLFRYASSRTQPAPVLFVPNLGISRPYVFDLLPGRSFFEHLTSAGFDLFLLDWGAFGPEDAGLTFDRAAGKILPRMWRAVVEASGRRSISTIGYCMGAALVAALAASDDDVHPAALVNMAGPIDFSRAGLFRRWLDSRYFPLDRVVATLGSIPPELIRIGGTLTRPTMGLAAALEYWWNGTDEGRRAELRGAARWVEEFIAVPGSFFHEWVTMFYRENRLYRGDLVVAGRPACLGHIRCPVLTVAAGDDPIAPPESVRALLEVVGTEDRTHMEIPGGHLSLMFASSAASRLWPSITRWLAGR